MPEDEGELRNLLSLLAELKKSRLPCVLVEQIGNVSHRPTILLRDVVRRGSGSGILAVPGSEVVHIGVGTGQAVVVLLLLLLGSSGGLMGMLMMASSLLMHPGRVALWVELVVPIEVRRGHHLGGGGGLPLTMHALRMVGGDGTIIFEVALETRGSCRVAAACRRAALRRFVWVVMSGEALWQVVGEIDEGATAYPGLVSPATGSPSAGQGQRVRRARRDSSCRWGLWLLGGRWCECREVP